MKKRTNSIEILLAVISEEYPQLKEDEKSMLAKIVTRYVELLVEARIEKIVDHLRENHDFLVKLL